MCFAGRVGRFYQGQSSTVGCLKYGAGTFYCQPQLPVDQWIWLSTSLSPSPSPCPCPWHLVPRYSANRHDLLQKWDGNGTAECCRPSYNLRLCAQRSWLSLSRCQRPSNSFNTRPLPCDLYQQTVSQLWHFIIVIMLMFFINGTKALVTLISCWLFWHIQHVIQTLVKPVLYHLGQVQLMVEYAFLRNVLSCWVQIGLFVGLNTIFH